MKIKFHGAARTVTGSMHLLEINGSRILLECGLFQGKRNETYERNRHFPFDPSKIDAVLLSNAHIDHSGNLPNLVKQGYAGKITATRATTHLVKLMLRDSGHIQEIDIVYANKKRAKKGLPPMEPLYTLEDAEKVASHFNSVEYDTPVEIIEGVRATFMDAGHILGSAGIALDITEANRKFRVWFSGDIGRRDLPILRDPVFPMNTDYLIMESTYGDKGHRSPEMAYQELREVVQKTVARGGKVIIPAFAVGRSQELAVYLHQMIEQGEIPSVPIYVDSPLAINASQIFNEHPECMDAETLADIRKRGHAALDFKEITYTRSVEESKAINEYREPAVIISASGMAEAGRILHHLRNNIENPRNTILIVGWQAPHTLGRRLADRETKIKIFGEKFIRKAEVETIGGLSAHAGRELLVEYASAVKDQVQKVFLVHGEERGALPLKKELDMKGFKEVIYPEAQSTFEI
ncbi:MAG: MBL fold metallo-hydrolase [Anaerolineae bacterium]|jgi:metallo-beta-lactamase family protein|nr:MBL fold metallo-hydrolase [Anaerolineae bacterium]MBT7072675.1 MBL fold metallo-hydrolase [Anaerolineae bacterium]MBT7326856.1 MBL fold metallo-hydrolase [Anaerolineae bacterium]